MDSTISSLSLGRSQRSGDGSERSRPQLFQLIDCLRPLQAPWRHLLDGVDQVDLGRGERAVVRDRAARRLRLRVDDGRVSTEHARLVRVPGGWLLEDQGSKNGCVVNGALAPRAMLRDGDVFELGHTFFLFREAPAPADVDDDVAADRLPAPLPALATFVAPLQATYQALARIAATPVSVLVLGETGTGKEVVARALHQLSGRGGAFVAVNCGALPASLIEAELFGHRKGAFSGAVEDRPGLVRSADGGTLFLDEIGELPAASQVAFLRVLQEQEVVPVGESRPVRVDLRICAATHRDLDQLVDAGDFRRDLSGRLMGLVVDLPPLRRRREDLGLLIGALLARTPGGERATLAPSAMRALLAHDWPINIRELDKCLTTALALAGGRAIEREHLPPALRAPAPAPAASAPPAPDPAAAPPPLPDDPDQLRALVERLLVLHEGNVAAVGRELGKGREQIHRWARRFGLDLESYRRK
ncbi:MAG TPA: sigma 54-interacting transcriptional regulator [Kofleriaceae bacterium]|nr:sigma 54-interacting transcriptional regulator [Kofleriaceae bacterium]